MHQQDPEGGLKQQPAPVTPKQPGVTPTVRSLKPPKARKRGRIPKPRESRPGKVLPTDRLNFTRQLSALRAFGAISGTSGKPVSNEEVAKLMGMKASTVLLTNPFFVDNGFLQRVAGQGLLPTPGVVSFARTHEWNPNAAAEKLAPIVASTWFGERLLPQLAYSPMEADKAIAELAEVAAAQPIYRAQVRVLLDYLEVTGLIQREGAMVKAGRGASTPTEPSERSAPASTGEIRETRETRDPARSAVATGFAQNPTEGVVQFHVAVRVDMAEFAGWPADRIASFFAGIAQVLAAKGAIEKTASE